MDSLVIRGGSQLSGKIQISGAKNSALKLMCASLLTGDKLTLHNVPDLADITTMGGLLAQLGVKISSGKTNTLELLADNIVDFTAPYELVRRMRASIIVLGPLLSRFGEAKISLPGGCAIGTRPVDLHLKALEKMGAEISIEDGYVHAKVAKRLRGAEIYFENVSVGATENTLMAATLARGETVLNNAAQEPEIGDLVECLIKMGAKIDGAGSNKLTIQGVDSLHGAEHFVVADRIETGSFIAAAAITHSEIELMNARPEHLGSVLDKLSEAGIKVTKTDGGIRVKTDGEIKPVSIITEPYPGFPTDMQAQLMAVLTIANGSSTLEETIFENRYMHVPELCRMGAKIKVSGNHAFVTGVPKLKAAEVMATDLRASFSLVIAALAAAGETKINRVYHIDRGYDKVEEKLRALGADIVRVDEKA